MQSEKAIIRAFIQAGLIVNDRSKVSAALSSRASKRKLKRFHIWAIQAKTWILPSSKLTTCVRQDVLIAYTDGSFTAGDPPKSGFGICFVKNGKEIGHCFGPSDADTSSRNVGGELMAATKAIELAQQLLEPELIVCHDFKNIQMWGDSIWKCNTEQTKAFRECVRQARENGLSITFGWVRGHTGNEFNEKADQYAALGAEGQSESPII